MQTNYGYVDIGPMNSGWAHFNTDRASFYFNKPVHATDKLQIYNTNTYLTGTEGKIAGNKIWHAGNDGSGSGMDADLLDGKHWSDIQSYIDNKHNPDNKIYFIATRSSSQNIPADSKIDFTAETDPFDCFDISYDRFVAPRKGLYFFAGKALKAKGKSTHVGVYFRVNNVKVATGYLPTYVGFEKTWTDFTSSSTVLKLNTGDYVDMWVETKSWSVYENVFYGIEL